MNMEKNKDVKASFSRLRERASALGITNEDLNRLDSLDVLQAPTWSKLALIAGFVITVCAICFGCVLVGWPVSRVTLIRKYLEYNDASLNDTLCLVGTSELVHQLSRPPVDCSFCRGILKPHRVRNVDPTVFEAKYAYTGQPLVIEDAMTNWTAPKVFSFEYFKQIYPEGSNALDALENECQFFPWGPTEFQSMGEVLRMRKEQASMAKGTKPWYIGWSNCHPETANKLRQHYTRPYFLPAVSQSSKTDWIFIGSPRFGAPIHIDSVMYPSWQSQIRGQKMWILEPPPECYSECARRINVPVKTGETIVLDTNKWFHATEVMGNDLSITIGSEYD